MSESRFMVRNPASRGLEQGILLGVLVASFVLAALPVSVTSTPVTNDYYPQPSYQAGYEAEPYMPSSYQPAYEPTYGPEPYAQQSYEPAYQPEPYSQPSYDSYKPDYQPAYDSSYAQPAAYGSSYDSSYQADYEPAYKPAYEPSYKPAYQPEYKPAYQPDYKPAYQPDYKPAYQADYKPAYEPEYKPAYQPDYKAPSYKVEYYPEYVNYEAITYRDMNESIHCGVIPAVNSELYRNSYGGLQYQPEYGYGKGSSNNLALTTPNAPFGKFPWVVLITDDYHNVLCEGTIVHGHYILTLTSCVEHQPLHKLRVRFGDWDILNNANEYESYKNVESRVCRQFPVTCSSKYSGPAYGYGYQSSQKQASFSGLTLLRADYGPNHDVYEHVNAVCLPEHYPSYQSDYKPAYQAPSYNSAPSYQPGHQSYQPAPYAPTPYAAPQKYSSPTYVYYSECYVAGYYGSPTTKLQNHKRPVPHEGYGYQAPPAYPQSSAYDSYSYESYESKIPKFAKVKQIKCESYGGYKQPPAYGHNCEENMCFVGVEGDACVADYGSAIVCLVPEREHYDAGYSYSYDKPAAYGNPSAPYGYQTPAYQPAASSSYSSGYGYAQNSYHKKEVRAAAAQDKVDRKRAAIVAVVEQPTQCTSSLKPQKYGYGYQAQEQQSKPIVAIKVTEKVVDFILEKFFEGGHDKSCPMPYYSRQY